MSNAGGGQENKEKRKKKEIKIDESEKQELLQYLIHEINTKHGKK